MKLCEIMWKCISLERKNSGYYLIVMYKEKRYIFKCILKCEKLNELSIKVLFKNENVLKLK